MDEIYWFDAATAELVPTPTLQAPEVMDSWLVVDGRARCVEAHERRFTESVTHLRKTSAELLGRFTDATRGVIGQHGAYFPRIECAPSGELGIRVRRAPQLSTTARLWTAPMPDPRRHPRIKGPDQRQLNQLRESAARVGANEAVMTDSGGYVLEGAFSAIGWWRGDTLCFPDSTGPILPSITRRLVEDIAHRRGIAVGYERVRPSEMSGLPVWVLSALHGIREAIGWIGRTPPAPAAQSREEWQRALDEYATLIRPAAPRPGEIEHA